ncbi:MAG: NAD+ synthase [Candidatus Aenigmatarchaeota archaeon]
MDYRKVAETIESFIREKTEGFNGGVIGLSGGLDSTVVAYLSVNAIGNDRVYGLLMPYFKNSNTDDAIEIANILKIGYEIIDIKPIVESFEHTGHFSKKIPKENLMARTRMCLLYGVSNEKGMLVLGTSNKSELETGYFTKYGDGGVDIEPIGDLYKTEVWELARFLGVSKKIIGKEPSADLSPGQTDEADLGMGYYTLDKILRGQTESADPAIIKKVRNLFERSQHKRELPPVARVER